ncbi:MAG: NAD(P)-binding domain-containing protein [Gammaproteobacteria bacterium]
MWGEVPAYMIKNSGVFFTRVDSEQNLRGVFFATNGLFDENIHGKLFIDMGTTVPVLTQELAVHVACII